MQTVGERRARGNERRRFASQAVREFSRAIASREACGARLFLPDMGGSDASLRLLAVLTATALSFPVNFRFTPPLAAVEAVARPRCAARRTVLCCTDMSAADRLRLRLVCMNR